VEVVALQIDIAAAVAFWRSRERTLSAESAAQEEWW